MKFKCLFFLCFLTFQLNSQVLIDWFEYSGLPHHIRENNRDFPPNTKLEFNFCTVNIPDSLIIWFGNDSLQFYLGSFAQEQGFVQYNYDSNGLTETYESIWNPAWFGISKGSSCFESKGSMQLIFTVPENGCQMRWKIVGNLINQTVYSFSLYQLTYPAWVVNDTIQIGTCGSDYTHWKINSDCSKTYYVYSDSSIVTEPEIKHPKCTNNGWIRFENYPQYNQFNLSAGIYPITISNSVCQRTFKITLIDDALCHIYIPNIFNPTFTNDNSTFKISADINVEYKIWIYDRWGELIHSEIYWTNSSGWSGEYKGQVVENGVYIYKIRLLSGSAVGDVFSGDVTVFR